MTAVLPLAFALALATAAASAAAATVPAADCGPPVQHPSGGDYQDAGDRAKLAVVEQFHFTAAVENLRGGASGTLGADLGYTLERFPNHHRALAALARLALRDKTARPAGARHSIDCYFERAQRFRPGDPALRSFYGSYLLAAGRADAARAQMLEAARLDPQDATTHYNLGLLFVKTRDYPAARRHARQAYGLGFPLAGLKNQLLEARQWEGAE